MARFTYSANVKRLAATSFFTDFATEMLYPIMPLLWSSLGFSAQMIGVIEGVAEAVAGLSKLLWGYLADRFHRYHALVVIGYGISAAMKPLLGITNTFIVPLAARNVERLGKAIRTAPRDAILAAESTPANRARIVGFHRSMDTLGAVVGPAVCLLLLHLFDGDLQSIFIFAAIPGALAVIAAWAVDDRKLRTQNPRIVKKPIAISEVWRQSAFKRLVIGLALFALVNSSDAFVILRLRDLGISNTLIVFAYMFYNAVYALSAKGTHRLTARLSLRGSVLLSLALFMIVYGSLSFDLQFAPLFCVLLVYGFFAGLFEVTTKTWMVNVLPGNAKATGVGLAGTVTSVGFLMASLLTGLLWTRIGPGDTLALLAVAAVVPFVYFGTVMIEEAHGAD